MAKKKIEYVKKGGITAIDREMLKRELEKKYSRPFGYRVKEAFKEFFGTLFACLAIVLMLIIVIVSIVTLIENPVSLAILCGTILLIIIWRSR